MPTCTPGAATWATFTASDCISKVSANRLLRSPQSRNIALGAPVWLIARKRSQMSGELTSMMVSDTAVASLHAWAVCGLCHVCMPRSTMCMKQGSTAGPCMSKCESKIHTRCRDTRNGQPADADESVGAHSEPDSAAANLTACPWDLHARQCSQ